MPFSLANFSHLVRGRGPGGFLRRGNTVVGSGSLATMLSSTRSVGSSQMALTRSWVFSRVRAVRYSSLLSLKTTIISEKSVILARFSLLTLVPGHRSRWDL